MYKLISAKFDPETKASIATIGTDLGIFEGIVTIREDDIPYTSKFFGCELAELRAYISYAKAKVKYYSAQRTALVNFYKTMKGTREFNASAYYVKQLDRHIQEITEQKNSWRRIVAECQKTYHKLVLRRDEMNIKLLKYRKEN